MSGNGDLKAKKELSTRRTLHADVSTRKGANGELFLDDSIPQYEESVKRKNSLSEKTSDEAYLTAVERGDMETIKTEQSTQSHLEHLLY